MAVIRLDGFTGISPAVDPRKLPDPAATLADGCRFEAGDLRTYNAPSLSPADPVTGSALNGAPPAGHVTTLYRHQPLAGQGALASPRFLLFRENYGVGIERISVAPSPIPNDIHDRIYWSRSLSYPRVCSQPTQTDIDNQGAGGNVRRLGVPRPVNPPTAEPIAGTTADRATITGFTKAKPCVVTVSANVFREGQRVLVDIKYAGSATTGFSAIAGKEFIVGEVKPNASKALEWDVELRGSDTTGATNLASGDVPQLRRVFSDADYTSRSYVYTLVTTFGEEGPPSAPSAVVDVTDEDAVRVTCNIGALPTGFTGISGIRLYRTQTGVSGTEYFLVAEFPRAASRRPAGESADLSLSSPNVIIDATPDIAVGELLPSSEWLPPPERLRGLGLLPNGIMAGFLDNAFYLSEPYMPHAWPDRYRRTTDRPIVGWASFGQSAVICTTGRPYLASGTDPASFSMSLLELDAPCINAGGIVSTGRGVLYPTHDGLAFVSPGETRILTMAQVTKERWAELWSNTMEAVWWDGRYIAISRDGKPTLCIRPAGDGLEISRLPAVVGAAPCRDPATDRLYYIAPNQQSGLRNVVAEFNPPGGSPMPYTWRSKLFTTPMPIGFGACQVFSDFATPVTIRILASSDATFVSGIGLQYRPGAMALLHQQVVSNPEPFRLPAALLSRDWQIEISGTASVQWVRLAETIEELRQIV